VVRFDPVRSKRLARVERLAEVGLPAPIRQDCRPTADETPDACPIPAVIKAYWPDAYCFSTEIVLATQVVFAQ